MLELKKISKQLTYIARHLVQEATHAFHIATTNGFYEFQVEWPSAAIGFPLIELQRKTWGPKGVGGFCRAFFAKLEYHSTKNEDGTQKMESWKTIFPFELGDFLGELFELLIMLIFRGAVGFLYHPNAFSETPNQKSKKSWIQVVSELMRVTKRNLGHNNSKTPPDDTLPPVSLD